VSRLHLLGLSHVGLAVPSIDEFRQTWGAVLGITDWLVRDLPQPDGGLQLHGEVQPAAFSRAAFARLADTAIELVEPHTGNTRTSAWLAEHGPGIHHLAFWVDDLPAALAALGDTVEVTYSPVGVRPGVAVLTTSPVGEHAVPPGFWAYTEATAARVPWCLELLDVRYADTVRAAFGDYLCYPGEVADPR
jgi:catechol 2,3-dioxygenase-like lactoylglutathione lyase family enzyme